MIFKENYDGSSHARETAVTRSLLWIDPYEQGRVGFPVLREGQVHVWRADLGNCPDVRTSLEQLLSPDERERASRIGHESGRQVFVSARGLLRLLSGQYLSEAPEAVPIVSEPGGKPSLPLTYATHGLTWSLSHTGDKLLMAFSRHVRVGVDLEREGREVQATELSHRFFHEEEAAAIAAVPSERRMEAFLHYWTAKEAVLKAIGRGLAGSLAGCRVDWTPWKDHATVQNWDGDGAADWAVRFVSPFPGHLGAVTADGPEWHDSYWNIALSAVRAWLPNN